MPLFISFWEERPDLKMLALSKLSDLHLLDYYTKLSLDAYWKKLVAEARFVNEENKKTGKTETSETGGT